ncbi:cold shock domain-containing protein [Sphaerisporangium sp. NPDC005288]|uniref:cold-shock protein n=1 Tax=Sphaerisporangium sp. NPDC005288 TaxID=3155114 RepID=UPI0033BBE329
MGVEPGSIATGVVVEWSDEEGWGYLRSADLPGDVFAHFSMIVGEGYRSLRPGQPVRFTWERAQQDGFDFRTIEVFTGDDVTPRPPGAVGGRRNDGGAYTSDLRIDFDQ